MGGKTGRTTAYGLAASRPWPDPAYLRGVRGGLGLCRDGHTAIAHHDALESLDGPKLHGLFVETSERVRVVIPIRGDPRNASKVDRNVGPKVPQLPAAHVEAGLAYVQLPLIARTDLLPIRELAARESIVS